MKNIVSKKKIPYFFAFVSLCLATGAAVGVWIFAFKLLVDLVVSYSVVLYSTVRAEPLYVPLFIGGVLLLAFVASLILRSSQNCRGGGIPTAITVLRGLISFSWLKTLTTMLLSSMITYFCAVPLGTEGPSVQMGTALGKGFVSIFSKKHVALDRYVMTGGACAGFAAATGAPITGIFFAFEEAHKRFSPMIFTSAALTVASCASVTQLLCKCFSVDSALFNFHLDRILPLEYVWTAVLVGVVCGFCALLFTKIYRNVRTFLQQKLSNVPFFLKILFVFFIVSVLGLASDSFIRSGHDIVESLLEGEGIWYLLLLYFAVRAILMIIANNVGVTGGLFVPTLAFGAILGALSAHFLIFTGMMNEQYYVIVVLIGIASFLGALSRTPIIAITFCVEALGAASNILPIIVGVAVSYLIVEGFGVTAFTDVVIEGKVEDAHRNKKAYIVDTELLVREDSFVCGKEIRDILWPPNCVVLSVKKGPDSLHASAVINGGDILCVHYKTYDREHTATLLEALAGKQSSGVFEHKDEGDAELNVPEL